MVLVSCNLAEGERAQVEEAIERNGDFQRFTPLTSSSFSKIMV